MQHVELNLPVRGAVKNLMSADPHLTHCAVYNFTCTLKIATIETHLLLKFITYPQLMNYSYLQAFNMKKPNQEMFYPAPP